MQLLVLGNNYPLDEIRNAKIETPTNTNMYSYKDFVGDVQRCIGAKVDYIAGSITLSKTPTVSRYKNNRHAVVKPVQKYLYALGYTEVGNADGIAGVKFEQAVNRYQREVLKYKKVDGEITKGQKMWKSLLQLI